MTLTVDLAPVLHQAAGEGLLDGACHCGTIRFKVRLCDGLRSARRCNCSYCSMRGAVAVSAVVDDLAIISGQDWLSTFQFNTEVAEHHFCARCGIYTHHRRRSIPSQFGVNVACLGISPFAFPELQVLEGRCHPSEPGGSSRVAGVLRYRAFPELDTDRP